MTENNSFKFKSPAQRCHIISQNFFKQKNPNIIFDKMRKFHREIKQVKRAEIKRQNKNVP